MSFVSCDEAATKLNRDHRSKQSKAMELLNEMVSEPYHLLHFLSFFSYFVIRISTAQLLSPDVTSRLFLREIQAALALGIFAAFKIVREENWEGFISDTLLFAKVFLLALTTMADYRLTLWYAVIFSAIYIFTQQPAFKKLGTSSKITPLQLESLLTEGSTSKLWLVEFRSSYSPSCIRSSRCFPELSITYSNKNFSFGIVDLGLFPNAAQKFGISLSGSMGQLPTYILFSHGSEVARYPELGAEGRGSREPITKKFLSQYFKLDLLLLEYINGK